jgi:hypothetical protein
MRVAGYAPDSYRRILLTYPSPVPSGQEMRFAAPDRELRGGCPLYDTDLSWANSVVVPRLDDAVVDAARRAEPRFEVLDLRAAFQGHRLCERGTAHLDETELTGWRDQGAADLLEWVNPVVFTVAPRQVVESLHPNYWGMSAQRGCVAAALRTAAGGDPRCVPTGRLSRSGAPVMRLE